MRDETKIFARKIVECVLKSTGGLLASTYEFPLCTCHCVMEGWARGMMGKFPRGHKETPVTRVGRSYLWTNVPFG